MAPVKFVLAEVTLYKIMFSFLLSERIILHGYHLVKEVGAPVKRKKEGLTRIGRTTSDFLFKAPTKPQLRRLTVIVSIHFLSLHIS